MKFALMAHVSEGHAGWGKEEAIVNVCQRVKKLELDGIDWLDTCGCKPKDIRRIADDFGFPAVCLTPLTVDFNFPDAKERQAGLEGVKKTAEAAAILGTDKIMLPMAGKANLTSRESRRNVIAGLLEAVKITAACKLTLSVEHYGTPFAPFRVSDDVNEAVRAVPGLKVTYDSGNVWFGGENAADGFTRSRENIVHVHFKDWEPAGDDKDALPGSDGKKYVMTPIGRGVVDHVEVLRAMKQGNYAGFVDLEYFGSRYETDDVLAESREYILKSLEQLG